MIDRAIGIAGLAFAILGIVAVTLFPRIDKRLAWAGFIVGILLLGVAVGVAFFPSGEAQSPAINGNCNNIGNNNVNCNTFNVGPQEKWPLSIQQAKNLGLALNQVPAGQRFKIPVLYSSAGEAQHFAERLMQVFRAHHWDVDPRYAQIYRSDNRGICLIFSSDVIAGTKPEPPNGKTLIKMFDAANIQYSKEHLEGTVPPDEFVAIYVGLPPLPPDQRDGEITPSCARLLPDAGK